MILWSSRAVKSLKRLPKDVQHRIMKPLKNFQLVILKIFMENFRV